MASQNLYHSPQVHGVYTRQHSHNQTQLPPQQMNNEPQFHHHPSPYHAGYLTSHYVDSPSNPYVGQSHSNSPAHTHGSVTARSHHSHIQVLQPPPTHTSGGDYEQRAQNYSGSSSENFYMGVDHIMSGSTHSVDPDLPHTGSHLPIHPRNTHARDDTARELSQPDQWAIPSSSQTSTINTSDSSSPPEYNSGSPENQALIINSNSWRTPLNAPDNGIDPNAFRTLPGYRREMNAYGKFGCFKDCTKGRFGRRGFTRRGNLVVHLRSCHKQAIPQGAPL